MRARIETVKSTEKLLVIRDIGNWSTCPTVTNDAEGVVQYLHLRGLIDGKRLFYYDSQGDLDELLHNNHGVFEGFRWGHIPSELYEL